MTYKQFEAAIDFIFYYKHGQKRNRKAHTLGDADVNKWVFDIANQNWIEFMETEKDRYMWNDKYKRWQLKG